MRNKRKQFNKGISLVEVTIVVAVIAIMILIASPVIKTMENAFTSSVSTEAMISAALTSARATAAKNQTYAGIRFQQDKDGNQYMIPIVYDYEKTNLENGFIAVKGKKPIKLPDNIIIFDLKLRKETANSQTAAEDASEVDITSGTDMTDSVNISDMLSFNVVMSANANLVQTEVRTRNIDKKYRPELLTESADSIFNGMDTNAVLLGMFLQDDYPHLGFGAEKSRNKFKIGLKKDFYNAVSRWQYYDDLEVVYINAYTGSIIQSGN